MSFLSGYVKRLKIIIRSFKYLVFKSPPPPLSLQLRLDEMRPINDIHCKESENMELLSSDNRYGCFLSTAVFSRWRSSAGAGWYRRPG